MTRPHTAEELRTRLLEIAADSSWAGWQRIYAKYAAREDGARLGFPLTPADLSDDAVRAALEDLHVQRRAEAFAGPGRDL